MQIKHWSVVHTEEYEDLGHNILDLGSYIT